MNMIKGKRTKEFQDFFTPYSVSQKLFEMYYEHLKKTYEAKGRRLRVLEPAVGSGNLLWPLLDSDVPVTIVCMDIQEEYIEHLAEKAKDQGYTIGMEKGLLTISN